MTIYFDSGNIDGRLSVIITLLDSLGKAVQGINISQQAERTQIMALSADLAAAVQTVKDSAAASLAADAANQAADAAVKAAVDNAIALITTLHTGGTVADADVQAAITSLNAAAADNNKAAADYTTATGDYNKAATDLAAAHPGP